MDRRYEVFYRFLVIRFSKWLISPDNTMAMADYFGNKAMKWTTREEINYLTFIEFLGPTGIRISPEGAILKPRLK